MSSQSVNAPAKPPPDRDALRKKFAETADSILKGLESKSQGAYDCDALGELGVFLHHVDATEEANPFLDFKPLSEIEYSSYKIKSADIPEHMRELYDGFDDAFNWSPDYPLTEIYLIQEKALQIARYMRILNRYSKKDGLSMRDHSKWFQIL